MNNLNEELKLEQDRVDKVVKKVSQRLEHIERNMELIKEEAIKIRKTFFDDVTVNLDNFTEAAETAMTIKQQAEVLGQLERNHHHLQKEQKILQRLKYSPYFGRIDFREENEDQAEAIYIGIGSFLDEEEGFLVYDWRAPISSLYYDYGPGPAQYEAPGGTVSGTMEQKRQFLIRDSEIKAMFDTSITIGDELLQEVLGKQADTKMKTIVSTIQKEQNAIIRNEKSRLLIVQGAAGSGKTSAALQRIAYLLYRYRNSLKPEQILLFSPNPLFNSYVSTVLPELGEENMAQTTFLELLEKRIGRKIKLQTPYKQMEMVLTQTEDPNYDALISGMRFKSSLNFLELINRYIAHLSQGDLVFKDIKFRGETIIYKKQIKKKFYELDPQLSIPKRLNILAKHLLEEIANIAKEEQYKPWVAEEINYLSKEEYRKAHQQFQRQKHTSLNTFNDLYREEAILSSWVVNQHLKPIRKRIKRLRFVNFLGTYYQLFIDPNFVYHFYPDFKAPQHWEQICKQTVQQLKNGILPYEDATPFLYLKEKIEGFHVNRSVRHVFIDEAQDYTPIQFAYLKQCFPMSKMTVLGDLNQAIYTHSSLAWDSITLLKSLFHEESIETIQLNRTYRSTKPIVQFTQAMIENGEKIIPFNRSGKKPVIHLLQSNKNLKQAVIHQIQEILDKKQYKTIAIIGKSAKECKEIYHLLHSSYPVQFIQEDSASFKEGVMVIPSYLAKGIEFDVVIIWNSSMYNRESERKLFYTACTRAMHELYIFAIEKLNPFILDASSESYELLVQE